MGLMLAGSMCVLPFLLPYHQLPIKSFQAEWLAVALGTAAGFVLAFARAPGIAVPASTRWLLALALLLLAHSLFGAPAYPQLPLTGAIYVLYAVLMILLGARLAASLSLDRAAASLACFILAGALLTALAGVIQFYGRPEWLEDVVAELRGGRAYGNIAQSNLYAVYLAWGLAALLFLWVRGSVSTGYMLTGTAVLNLAAVLSGSRGWLLYLCWIALLVYLSCRQRMPAEAGRRRGIILAILFMAMIIQVSAPWMNQYFGLQAASPGGLERALSPVNYAVDSRWQAWQMGWQIFTGNMLFGTGLGEFAGAAFAEGLPLLMAQQGTVWTSPHNIVLQLLAETGIAGTILVAGALAAWGWKVARTCNDAPVPAELWIIACIGVTAIQSLVEYPLWNAHFLGVTALLMGVVETSAIAVTQRSVTMTRAIMGAASLVIGIALAIILRDYVRLDSVLITGTTQTLSTEAQREKDKSVIMQVAQGPLSPVAELWLMRGLPLNRTDLDEKLAMSARVLRYWPENSIVTRRAVLLALSGNRVEAGLLLAHTLKTFPASCGQTKAILEQVSAEDNAAVAPLRQLTAGCR